MGEQRDQDLRQAPLSVTEPEGSSGRDRIELTVVELGDSVQVPTGGRELVAKLVGADVPRDGRMVVAVVARAVPSPPARKMAETREVPSGRPSGGRYG